MNTKIHDFTYQENTDPSPNQKLLYAHSSIYAKDWLSILHTHYFSELFFILDGAGHFIIEDKLYPVSVNDLVIVKPNILHTEISTPEHPLKYIVLGIEGLDLTPNTAQDEDVLFCITNLNDIKDTVLFLLKQLISETDTQAFGYERLCQNYIENLVITLNRHPKFSTTLIPVDTKKNSRLCTTIRRHIDSHYKDDITLDSLANLVHVSKYHIIHTFTEEYGISPIKYLSNKRIEESCHLLQTTDYPLSSISRTLGFSSPSYFSQAFKKEMHVAPLEYRKTFRKNPEE